MDTIKVQFYWPKACKPQVGIGPGESFESRNQIMNRNKLIPAVALLMLASLAFLSSCEEKGSVEKVGDAVEEAAHDTKRAIEDATD
jgi:hypothetical protein